MMPSGSLEGRVRLLEQAHVLLQIVAPFAQCLRIPFAGDREKVAAIDVNGAGQPRATGLVTEWMTSRPSGSASRSPRDFAPAASILPSSAPGIRRQKMLSSRPV